MTSDTGTTLTDADATLVTQLDEAVSDDQNRDGCLVIIYGDELGRRIPVTQAPITIGRASNCEIFIDEKSISRTHCQIFFDKGWHRIKDLESTNGTLINDQPIEEHRLRDGDQIKVGRTIFKYISGDEVEAQYHEEIYRLMTIDGLTQLHNKRYFDDALEREMARAVRYQRVFSVILFDIDHFKQVNDSQGHLAGDAVLRQLGGALLGRLRRNDVAARIGGEEIAILAPEADLAHAKDFAEILRKLIEETTFRYEGETIVITASAGVAEWNPDYDTGAELLAAADKKLYEAKNAGRNQVCA